MMQIPPKNITKKRILIFRFSALGDVAMTVPVVKEFLIQNPDTEIVYVSRSFMKPLFSGIEDLYFIGIDLKDYKGFPGLYKLYKELSKLQADAVADLHNVLRTKVLRIFFKQEPILKARLDKGRKDRKTLLKSKGTNKKPLKPMSERYADVFRGLGYKVELSHLLKPVAEQEEKSVGFAPFARYESKMYPLEKSKIVAEKLAENGFQVYLFGSKEEAEALKSWDNIHENIHCLAGKLSFEDELKKISKLSLMISMDSANMHLASMLGVKTVSLWGSTHPSMGFLGYGQALDSVIQDERMDFRPVSVFGKVPEKYKDFDFFQHIQPEDVVKTVMGQIPNQHD